MSQLRHDALSGQDVIVAAGRAARPVTFPAPAPGPDSSTPAACAFCPGSEGLTPPEVARFGAGRSGEPGWQVRAFPNLYPIVGGPDAGAGAGGVHEVVALSPDHGNSFGQLTDDAAVAVVDMWRDRTRVHLAAGYAFAFAIVNHLPAAGASIAHPHAQVFAIEVIPPAVAHAVDRFRDAGHDLVADDASAGPLTIARNPAWSWCPSASPSPYFVRVAHAAAGAQFDAATDDVVAETAIALRDTLALMAQALGDFPYNIVVRTAPPGDAPYHWYVDIIPRVAIVAGFEQATGILVNTTPPEHAATVLRGEPP